jgi:hypothetical protein
MASERGGRELSEQTRLPEEHLPATPLELRIHKAGHEATEDRPRGPR